MQHAISFFAVFVLKLGEHSTLGRIIMATQSGNRRFSDLSDRDKPTRMKDRKGLALKEIERKDPFEGARKRSSSGTKVDRMKQVREPANKPTEQKDRKGLERKPAEKPAEKPSERPTGARDSSGTNMLRSIAGGAARLGLKGAGPVGALVSMTGPAGTGSDKPSGPLMKGTFGSGGRRSAGRKASEISPDRKGDSPLKQTSTSEMKGDRQAAVSGKNIPKPKPRPERKAEKSVPKPRPERKAEKKVEKKVERKAKFKGNWTGAAPTAMQKRGGRKVKNSSLVSYLRSK